MNEVKENNQLDKEVTLQELENQKIKLKRIYIISIITTIALNVGSIYLVEIEKVHISLFALVLAISIIISLIVCIKETLKYEEEYETYYTKHVLAKVFNNIKYYPDKGISEKTVAETETIDMRDRYTSNHLVTGKYKDIDFTEANIQIEIKYPDRQNHYRTTLKGRWMIFNFNKEFKTNFQVRQRKLKRLNVGFIDSITNYIYNSTKQQITIENDIFNKNYKAYTTKQTVIDYTLPETLIEKIIKLKEIKNKKILLCFMNEKLHIGIYRTNKIFFPKYIFKKISQKEIIQKDLEDIKIITTFIDELLPDKDLFKDKISEFI